MDRDERLVGVKELHERTGLQPSWWYAQVAARKVPHLKLGKYLRFRVSEVERWLEAHRRGDGQNKR